MALIIVSEKQKDALKLCIRNALWVTEGMDAEYVKTLRELAALLDKSELEALV